MTPTPDSAAQGGVASVHEIETVPIDHPFSDEETPPIWRVMVGEYCADFDFEQAARNFAGAINAASSPPAQQAGVEDAITETCRLIEYDMLNRRMTGDGFVAERDEVAKIITFARAALARLPDVPAGYVMVPVEPTKEMLRAVDGEDDDKFVARGRAYSAWSAMIATAPAVRGEGA